MPTDQKFMYYVGTHPAWQYKGSLKFEEAFECVGHRLYNVRGASNHSIYLPDTHDGHKICCICGKPEGEVTFAKEAHIIPACLGNRIFFSLEECDQCNEKFGREFESHLAGMTEAERGFFQIPTRGAPPKWTTKGKKSQFAWDPDRGIIMSSSEADDVVKLTLDEENKKIKIKGPMPSFEPVRAVKSALHSAWLLLSREQREKQSHILDIINDKILILPFVYASGYLPHRSPEIVELRIYGKKVPDIDIPSTVVMLYVGHTFLMWSSPNLESGQYIPHPLPIIRAPIESPPPILHFLQVPKLEYVSKKRMATFHIAFDKIEKGSSALVALKREKKDTGTILPSKVNVRISRGQISWQLGGFHMKVKNLGSTDPRIILSSKEQPCTFVISLKPFEIKKISGLTYKLKYFGWPARKVFDAIKFMEELAHEEGTLIISDEEGKEIFSFHEFKANGTINLKFEKAIAERLAQISDLSGTRLVYPTKIDDSDLTDLQHVFNVFTGAYLAEDKNTFSLTAKVSSPSQLDQFQKEATLTYEFDARDFFLFGQKISLPKHKVTMFSAIMISAENQGVDWKINGEYKGLKYELL